MTKRSRHPDAAGSRIDPEAELARRLSAPVGHGPTLLLEPGFAEALARAGLDDFERLFAAEGPFLDRNRLRDVIRLDIDGLPFFRKRQHGIKPRDRMRAWSRGRRLRSHSREEAQNLLTLEHLGYRVPRPVALGEAPESRSLLVLAELAGRPLDEYVASIEDYDGIAEALACLCRQIVEDRVYWPDLDARHVFVLEDDGALDLGLLDVQRLAVGRSLSDRKLRKMRERLKRSIAPIRGSVPLVHAFEDVLS